MLLSKRGYARHRAERGLPGGTLAAIQRALREGRIATDGDGKIDPKPADQAWADNTRVRLSTQTRPTRPLKQERSHEFMAGAEWLAQEICCNTRRNWPAFMSELNFDYVPEEQRRAMRSVMTTLMLHMIESWLSDYIEMDALPPIDWSGFEDAATVALECAALRAEWETEPAAGGAQ
jgi:hypothetical protein